MLVLSRKENERIRLGDSIVVTVVRVSGGKVRLGIEAPADMVVLRDELAERLTAAVDLPPLESGFAPGASAAAVKWRRGFLCGRL